MRKNRGLTALLGAFIGSLAQADITFNIINATEKPLEFSLMVPRTTLYSDPKDGSVPAGQSSAFTTNSLLPVCIEKGWSCSKLQPVIHQWGQYVVFVECPKTYNTRKNASLWYKVSGNDNTNLVCRQVSRPKPAATPLATVEPGEQIESENQLEESNDRD